MTWVSPVNKNLDPGFLYAKSEPEHLDTARRIGVAKGLLRCPINWHTSGTRKGQR